MQAEKLLCQLYHCDNGLDASIATTDGQTQGDGASIIFRSASFHAGDISNRSSTEVRKGDGRNMKTSVPAFVSRAYASLCQPVFTVSLLRGLHFRFCSLQYVAREKQALLCS